MAELPVREQDVRSRQDSAVCTHRRNPQHTVSVLSPSRYAREDRETSCHAAQGTLHGTELLCIGRPGIKSER